MKIKSQWVKNTVQYALSVYHKKNSDQFDFLSFSGKVGSMVIPGTILPKQTETSEFSTQLLFSRTFIDADEGWECIINYQKNDGNPDADFFRVVDNDGTQLFSDSGSAFYSYDGCSTYIFRRLNPLTYHPSTRYWRCRTDLLADAAPRALSKSAASGPLLMTAFMPAGGYRISFAPSAGGKTTVQLFDMLGKLVFSKNVGEITRPVSFTVPEAGMPQTPFIAKFANEKGTVVRKEIPVR